MFGRISHRYDLLNHLLSLGTDKRWRRRLARSLALPPQARILDLGCGTGDLAFAVLQHDPDATCIGVDFCEPMLSRGAAKARARPGMSRRLSLVCGDAMALPFREGSFDLVMAAFVVRNLSDLTQGLREVHRVLRPGGQAAFLEFFRPDLGILGPPYAFYFGRVLPFIGDKISGVRGAYEYLRDSVNGFLSPQDLQARMQSLGFSEGHFQRWSRGIVALHLGRKPER